MAKRKQKPKKPEPEKVLLTDDQLILLANKLRGTRNNVYTLVKTLFRLDVTDSVFDQLKETAKLFKCEECNEWMDLQSREPELVSDICRDCVDDMNDADEESFEPIDD